MASSYTRVTIADLDVELRQTLTLYHQNVNEAIDQASKKAAKDLAKRTKATAPVGARGSFRKHIASKLLKKNSNGSTYVWYVKSPDHRLTHLLVKGHATRDGGRTRADPFLQNALAETLPEYEQAIKEAIQNGK